MEADRDALARYLNGDERAFEELVIRYEAKVRHVAFGVLRDRELAEDVAQETFLTAYRKAKSYRGEGTVRSWLFRIAVRRALDELRRRGRKSEVALPDTQGVHQSHQPHKGLEAAWDLDGAMDTLVPEHRVALMLKEVEGLSYQEIAESLGWPIGTVGTRIHRARLELKAALQERTDAVS
jgi:RNA polymerase sigma-70 factor (ECF subfamily)